MSELKISEAAKQLVASFVDDNAWNSLSAHWKETASRTAQGIINSELDRIAGPLVEAVLLQCLDLGRLNCQCVLCRQAREVKQNYHKERGE